MEEKGPGEAVAKSFAKKLKSLSFLGILFTFKGNAAITNCVK